MSSAAIASNVTALFMARRRISRTEVDHSNDYDDKIVNQRATTLGDKADTEAAKMIVIYSPQEERRSRLFIQESSGRAQERIETRRRPDRRGGATTKPMYSRNQMGRNPLLFPLLLLIAFQATVLINLVEAQKPMPTVIVRGFLNYRTTVDGTVLVFTPDAGSAQTSSVQVNSITSSVAASVTKAAATKTINPFDQQLNDAPANRFDSPDQISPSATQVDPATIYSTQLSGDSGAEPSSESPFSSTSGSPSGQLLASGSSSSGGESEPKPQGVDQAADEWRPISSQATPPLAKPLKTVFRPNQQQVAAQMATFQTIGASESMSPQAEAPVASASVAPVPATTTSAPQQPPSQHHHQHPRAKRPQLGFNGQSIRGGKLDRVNRLKTQDSNSAQQSAHGSINGIRRPGLSTTPAPPTVAVSSQQQPPTDGLPSDQLAGRLPGSGPNKKRGFKRPPLVPTSPAKPSPIGSQTLQENSGPVDPIASVASETDSMSNVAADAQPQSSASVAPLAAVGAPVVGSDEVLSSMSESTDDSLTKPMSRSGEQKPRGNLLAPSPEAKSLSGQLVAQSNDPFNLDTLFQGDAESQSSSTPQTPTSAAAAERPAEESQHRPSHASQKSDTHNPHHPITNPKGSKHSNDKLTGWMDQHMHQKFVPRPAGQHQDQQPGRLSQQLSASLGALEPSFSSNLPQSAGSSSLAIKPTPSSSLSGQESSKPPQVGSLDEQNISESSGQNSTIGNNQEEPIQLQTITKTYSTVMTSTKTRMVPLQVKSSTAIYTITEQYVITKMLTAYQTMPMGEFILPETLSTRAPFEMFNENSPSDIKIPESSSQRQPVAAAPAISAPSEPQQQEQPISLEPKSPNDWLHDFTNNNNNNLFGNNPNPVSGQEAQQNLAALLEQQAQQANLAGQFGPLGEPLDGLASQLDPATLLADGTINIPDLNNPLVLAAAIQNPQLAAVILAAQQLRLQQQRNKQLGLPPPSIQSNQQQQLPQANQVIQLQPSYSTSLSTTIRPSTYTMRDTMYTTRLVSFKDGRTVRTRTVSEPGSVIEQVLTTMATEVTPVTITIRPTGLLTVPSGGQLATAAPAAQSTINNALIATQLASLLARRQQQVQPSLGGTNPSLLSPSGAATPQQLLALQQLLRQQQQQSSGGSPTAAKQFQPNIQQLLQGMQSPQGQQQNQQQQNSNQQNPTPAASNAKPEAVQANRAPSEQQQQQQQQFTPPLPLQPTQLVTQPNGPITTVFTNLQVRTYTVHNAFKTIYRTITSTLLVTSTLFPGGVRPTQLIGG